MIINGSEDSVLAGRALIEIAIALFLAYNLSFIVHEGGHLVFGLLTGYRFCSFRIWSLMLVRQGGRMRFRRFKLAGTGGQCLMIPPEKGESKSAVILYNLGGVIFNFVFSLLCLLLYVALPTVYLLSEALKISAVFSLFVMLTNGIPLNVGGIANDGMNALHLSKNPDAAEAFRKTLLINASQTEGVRISDMPDEWFTLPDGADMQNVHCASLAVCASSRPLDREDTIEAENQISALLNSNYNITGLHKNLLKCDLIYCRLVNDSEADISGFITGEQDKFMRGMKTYPAVIRTEYTLALLFERNEEKAKSVMQRFDKDTKNYPYRQDIDAERTLMQKAQEAYISRQNIGQN